MDQTEAFFTQTIVGAPFTVLLGRRRTAGRAGSEGLNIPFTTGESQLTRLWQEWAVLPHVGGPVGVPQRRPGKLRRVLERHALWVGVVGLVSLVVSLMFWGVVLWK